MARDSAKALQSLSDVLKDCLDNLQRIDGRVVVRPRSGAGGLVKPAQAKDADGAMRFDVGPVGLRLPERPNSSGAMLYVVIQGFIELEVNSRKPYRTRSFGTQVGYFRMKDDAVHHILGVHYDYDDHALNHPVFHAQLCTQLNRFHPKLVDWFNLDPEADKVDYMDNVLRGARIPSAQLDLMASLTQLGADHLLPQDPGAEAMNAFLALSAVCATLVGARGAQECFVRPDPLSCYRANHWYDSHVGT